jgi:hypothetical protein
MLKKATRSRTPWHRSSSTASQGPSPAAIIGTVDGTFTPRDPPRSWIPHLSRRSIGASGQEPTTTQAAHSTHKFQWMHR